MVTNEKVKKIMDSIKKDQIIKNVYKLISDLWCSPTDINIQNIKKDSENVIKKLEEVNKEAAILLQKFIEEKTISEESYIDLFELDPKCPLYLGTHSYDEPKTCAGAGVSDRNKYMIELRAIYKHFEKIADEKELPDYLPLMIDFLSLTINSKNDSVRGKFINEYLLPFLPPVQSKLKELKTPYVYLIDVLDKITNIDLETQLVSKIPDQKMEVSHVG